MSKTNCTGHTPWPWRATEPLSNGEILIKGEGEAPQTIASIIQSDREHTAEANARHIVGCVNTMPVALEALRIVAGELRCIDGLMGNVDVAAEALRKIREVLT